MKITVCIGSSCHLKGSRHIVEGLQQRIREHGLDSQIGLAPVEITQPFRRKSRLVDLRGFGFIPEPPQIGKEAAV